MKSIVIAIGETHFEIQEFTLGQVEQIHEALARARESGHTRASTNREIIAAALCEDHPAVTAESLKGMRVHDIQQIATAADQILEFGGWVRPAAGAPAPTGEDSKQGEAQAG